MAGIDLSEIRDLIQRNVNSKEIANLLIAILEKSENNETRLELLKFIGAHDLNNASYFEMLENYLISDAQEEIRALAAELIIQNYSDEGLDALEWTIVNDSSPLVLREIYNLLKKSNNPNLLILESILYERLAVIAQKYELSVEEVPFLIDLGIKFMNPNYYIGNQDFHFIYENDVFCIIKEQHITEIGISFIKEIPESIGLLINLEYLDLSFSYISTLPCSMKNLINLKSIDLSWNEFTEIPGILKFLDSIETINISHNKLKLVPNWVNEIKNLIIQ